MTKHELWLRWKAQGITRDQAALLFDAYEWTYDRIVKEWERFLTKYRVWIPIPTLTQRLSVIYAMRQYDAESRGIDYENLNNEEED